MRTFNDLTESEQEQAREVALNELLQAIMEGMRFNDEANGDDLQARIDAACERAEEMQTPWFAHEYVMEVARDDLEAMARADAEESLYPDASDRIIHLPAS